MFIVAGSVLLRASLQLESTILPAGGEASLDFEGWLFLSLQSGSGYWLAGTTKVGLESESIFVVYGQSGGRFLGSQLGESHLVTYGISEQALTGLVSAEERASMAAAGRSSPVRTAPADSLLGARAREALNADGISPVARRCRLVELLADLLEGDGSATPAAEAPAGAGDRFQEWLRGRPEAAIASVTLEELAGALGCSPRHVSRLFQEKFGMSFRRRQTELRLDRARALLLQSEAKIIQVALESGYHHLGLFNTLFKRRFGMTPTEMRRKKKAPSGSAGGRRLSATAGILAGFAAANLAGPFSARAETPAAANSAPAARSPSGTNAPAAEIFEVRRYEVEGNTLLPGPVVAAAMSDYTGPAVDFNTIRQALSSLQLAYRGRGWATVSVSLPPQKITNGVIHVNVTEGRLTEIRVTGNHWFGSNNVLRALPALRTNVFLNSRIFQADLDNANGNPDRQIYPQIQPGADPGTSSLVLKVKDQLPLHGRFELNNQNTPSTPELRGNASLQYNNLFDREHGLGLQYMFAPQAFKEGPHWNLLDKPEIASYSGYYRVPLSSSHSVEEEILAQPQRFGFDEVTKKFRLPPTTGKPELTIFASRLTTDTGLQSSAPVASNSNSTNGASGGPVQFLQAKVGEDISTTENIGFRVSKPVLWLSNRLRATISVGADIKNFQKVSYNTNVDTIVYTFTDPVSGVQKTLSHVVPLPFPTRYANVSYLPLTARWDGSVADKFGSSSLGVGSAMNFAGGPFSPRSNFETTTLSSKASGSYLTLQMSASHEFNLPDEWVLAVRADGQWASEPLISNEQFGVGGTAGVRGYQEGARYGDRGWRAAVEQRTPLIDIGMVDGTMPLRFRGIAFTDYGRSYLVGAPSTGSPTLETLWGAGAGVSGSVGTTVDFRCTIAWALRETTTTPAGSYRIYFGVGAQF